MIMLALAPPSIAVVSSDHRCATPIPPVATGRSASSLHRSRSKQAFNTPRQQSASVEIPIAVNARPRHISRGFLPWRFAYAGPSVRRATIMGPASANLHKLRSLDAQVGGLLCPQQRTSSARPLRSEKCHNRTHAAQQKNSYWIIASPSGPTGIAGISMPGRLAVQRPTSVAPPTTPSARGKCLTSASVRENPPIRRAVIIDY
jgi:hypothetical protein